MPSLECLATDTLINIGSDLALKALYRPKIYLIPSSNTNSTTGRGSETEKM